MTDEFIENELIIITKQTYEKLINSEGKTDALILYLFYYYVAKWQKTNRVYSTTKYAANALNWSEQRVRKIKKVLKDLKLIDDCVSRDSGNKITKHYVYVKYVFARDTVSEIESHTVENPHRGESTPWESHTVENLTPNALSNNNEMLKVDDNKMLEEKIEKCSEVNVEKVKDLFNTICISLPPVKMLTKERKQKIRNASALIDDFESFFRRVENSDFLCGRTSKPWSNCSFEWILRKSNIVKILEGNYDNRGNSSDDPYGYKRFREQQGDDNMF